MHYEAHFFGGVEDPVPRSCRFRSPYAAFGRPSVCTGRQSGGEAFETLIDANVLPPEATDVVDYFEDTWIGHPNRRGRRASKFAVQMRNCYEAGEGGMPKTNNVMERWHTGFEATLGAVHPNIFKFLEAQYREQMTAEADREFTIVGQPLLT